VNSPAHAIEVAALEKRYGPTVAVDGISFSIASGEVFGLLGPNGAGKTTTVEILEGYRRADAGDVRVLGVDPWRDGSALRPRIGVMLQEGGLYPGVRPLEALQLFASFYDDPDEPERLLTLVGLDDSRHTLVRRMSGGQQQRLSLALALIGKPHLVFLDEPTAGMDPHARSTTWSMIRELRDRGTTVVLTTHAMAEAEQLCDRVGIIDHGKLLALGTVDELIGSHGGKSLVTVQEVVPGDGVEEIRERTVATLDPAAEAVALLKSANVRGIKVDRPDLETVFLALTGRSLRD
jgi:ABC-2 type transport system ATP-binding protein